MRKIKEIKKEENITTDKMWYHRYLPVIKRMKEKDPVVKKDIKRVLMAAKDMEKKYGKKNLGPYSIFKCGMLNGRLETIRWVLGDDWGKFDI
ncbi:MAG: hypothetical protein Q7R73_02940 [bacterium]|nr:hypothetical protein [bacterium]